MDAGRTLCPAGLPQPPQRGVGVVLGTAIEGDGRAGSMLPDKVDHLLEELKQRLVLADTAPNHHAGVVLPVVALAERIGLPELIADHVSIVDADNSAGANAMAKSIAESPLVKTAIGGGHAN
jgi:hypothetical protein